MLLTETLKNKVLTDLAHLIATNESAIIAANQADLDKSGGLDHTLVDRLKVDAKKVASMVASVNEVIKLEDPQGKVLHSYQHPNGMTVENRAVPFGKILIIYESRPDVTIEAAISAFKSGNKIYLKGGKESLQSNLILVKLWHEALQKNNVSTDYVTYLNINREQTQKLLKENTHQLDLIIPRGGEGLINYIKDNTNIPLIISGRGNNFLLIDENVDFEMAINIALNGKSRLSVCNALDKIIFHKDLANLRDRILELKNRFNEIGIEVVGDKEAITSVEGITTIADNSVYAEEFLSAKVMFTLVDNFDEAIEMINEYSGGHSATIVTNNQNNADHFLNGVDCAVVYHNASTRFTDGGQLGFGAEMAISTQKLHFRGPVAHGQLVTNKWFVHGSGQIRD